MKKYLNGKLVDMSPEEIATRQADDDAWNDPAAVAARAADQAKAENALSPAELTDLFLNKGQITQAEIDARKPA